jgi:hypothetical protein
MYQRNAVMGIDIDGMFDWSGEATGSGPKIVR